MEILDYEILVQELNPTIGKSLKYCATLQFVSVKSGEGHKKIYPDLGESTGVTEEEARQKMQKIYEQWLKVQK